MAISPTAIQPPLARTHRTILRMPHYEPRRDSKILSLRGSKRSGWPIPKLRDEIPSVPGKTSTSWAPEPFGLATSRSGIRRGTRSPKAPLPQGGDPLVSADSTSSPYHGSENFWLLLALFPRRRCQSHPVGPALTDQAARPTTKRARFAATSTQARAQSQQLPTGVDPVPRLMLFRKGVPPASPVARLPISTPKLRARLSVLDCRGPSVRAFTSLEKLEQKEGSAAAAYPHAAAIFLALCLSRSTAYHHLFRIHVPQHIAGR